MAILEVPFAYRAEYVAHGRRVPQAAWVLDSAPIRLLEASESEAPVAARRMSPRTGPSAADPSLPPYRPLPYRALDGALLRPYARGAAAVFAAPMGLADARADLARWIVAARLNRGDGGGAVSPEWSLAFDGALRAGIRGAVAQEELRAREWLGDDRAARRASLARALDGKAALVGGILHVPSLGPAWHVDEHAMRSLPEYGVTRGRASVFRGDREAQGRDWARHLGTVRPIVFPRGFRIEGRIEILDPAPFASVPSEADALADAAAEVCRAFSDRIGEAHPDVISLFAEARRLSLRPQDPGADLVLVAERLAVIERALAPLLPQGGGRLSPHSDDAMSRVLWAPPGHSALPAGDLAPGQSRKTP